MNSGRIATGLTRSTAADAPCTKPVREELTFSGAVANCPALDWKSNPESSGGRRDDAFFP
jgi:hypothetical protein